MEYLLTAAQMSAADRYTSDVIGVPSIVLMERAALGVAEEVCRDFPEKGPHSRIAVLAGRGNNGADALAAGRILAGRGYEVSLWSAGGSGRPDSLFSVQSDILAHYGLPVIPFERNAFLSFRPDIIIDGLFGTGLSREVTGPYAAAVAAVGDARETCGSRIYAVDIPSGISGTTGEVCGCAVRADVTVTFAFYKRGHFLYPGCEYCGKVVRKEIGITGDSLPEQPQLFTYRTEKAGDLLPARDRGGNKGTFGKVLVIAGSRGVSGACTMCAGAVLRMGAGMVKVFTWEGNRVILQETVPEAMCSTWQEEDLSAGIQEKLIPDLDWADVVAVGPGMGKGEFSMALLRSVLEYAAAGREGKARREKGLVIDADAIRLIAEHDLYDLLKAAGQAVPVILTPHMAECAALLGMTVPELREKRFSAIKDFANLYSCIIIGKDARTLVVSPGEGPMYLNTSGNDGLSTAGSGDVLTGVTAACLAQGMDGFSAACAASYIHGLAADRLSETIGKRSMTATDLIGVLKDKSS